jgi:putative oxidoreductase
VPRSLLNDLNDAALFNALMLLLRVVAGPTIFWHGYNKMFRGGRIAGTARWFGSMRMRPNGTVHAYAASLTEMGTGVLLVLGLLTPLAAAGVIGIMTVAAWTVHRHAFLITKEGVEYVLVFGVLCFAIAALGPGAWSLDEVVGILEPLTADGRGALIAGVLGLGAGVFTLLACYRPPVADAD